MDSLKVTSGSVFLILLILGILWKMLFPSLLEQRGVVVDGFVFDRGKVYGRFGTIYYLKYTYHYGSKSYSHRQKVDEDTYHIWSEVGEAKVRCLPVLPFISAPGSVISAIIYTVKCLYGMLSLTSKRRGVRMLSARRWADG